MVVLTCKQEGTVGTEVEVPSGVSSGWVGGCVDTQAGRYCGYRS